MGSVKMQLKITLLAVIAISLFLAGCGGDSNNPYDGTWALVYPSPGNEAASLGIAGATCVNYPGSITITNAEGSSTVTGSCTTAASGVVATPIYYIGVSITANKTLPAKTS